MKNRLRRYLEKIGLAAEASNEDAVRFHQGLTGLQRTIANVLDYDESDKQAATTADVCLRSMGLDVEDPSQQAADDTATLEPVVRTAGPAESEAAGGDVAVTTARTAAVGTDGASADGTIEDALAAERKRVAAIRKAAREVGAPEELVERAIAEGQQVSDARLTMLEWYRTQQSGVEVDFGGSAPSGHSRNSVTGHDAQSLVAALMIGRGNGSLDDPTRHQRTYNRVTGQFSRATPSEDAEVHRAAERGHELAGLSMCDIVARCLALDGIRVSVATPGGIVAAMQERAASLATSTLVGVFTQAFGAMMLESYDRTEDTTEGWVSTKTNPNFFAQERTRLKKTGALTKHVQGQQAELMDIEDTKAFAKVNRYSGRFAIDEMDLQNDTFGALNNEMPSEMGDSAKQLRPDLVYALLLANPNVAETNQALFSGAHGNLGSGVLSKAVLQDLFTRIQTQTEGEANINLTPKYVIAPASLAFDLDELLRVSARLVTGENATRTDFNALAARGLTPRYDSRLDNGVIDPNTGAAYAGSTTGFYMATRGDGKTIEVTYLRGGSRSPQVRSGVFPPGMGQWGVGMDVKLDIGSSVIGYRGMAYSPGT